MAEKDIKEWPQLVRQRYESYLKTSFFFNDPHLRESFENALKEEGNLLTGPFEEPHHGFASGQSAQSLAEGCFPEKANDLLPALIDHKLYSHQEQAIRATFIDSINVVVATGTASGKTESFLYPILFELYRQHLIGDLTDNGVRAMILYPMNALANDQRERLGEICRNLKEAGSAFEPSFGQYIGQTPENRSDSTRNGIKRAEDRLPGELVFREEMRKTPPHILLTNYSMLEYLLIRPNDSPLFDSNRGEHWQFIVLDEAHQYRGTKGIEMGMLVRRLKQRLRDGGRRDSFRCIATSATMTSSQEREDKCRVADFAEKLFGEGFSEESVILGKEEQEIKEQAPRRYHAFLRALEGAFLIYSEGKDKVVLNRKSIGTRGEVVEPLEIALCRECGQHYYVGRERDGWLKEADRDPSHLNFGVDYYLPTPEGNQWLCRQCGLLSSSLPNCDCVASASIRVEMCDSEEDHPDRLKECIVCGYRRGGIGDPVQEIVHGSDGPNSVISTALHELLPASRRKVLAFADSRQEAAFFAWYAQDSYEKLRDRNLILRAIMSEPVAEEGLSIDDLRNRMSRIWEESGLFDAGSTNEQRTRELLTAILREAITDEKRLSLSGVGLVNWSVSLNCDLMIPESIRNSPWNFDDQESFDLIRYVLDEMRPRSAVNLPAGAASPNWGDVSPWPQRAFGLASPGGRKGVMQWGAKSSAVVNHLLRRVLEESGLSEETKAARSVELMEDIWRALREGGENSVLQPGTANGTFRLDSRWLRVKPASLDEIWECSTCGTLTGFNLRDICPRNRCPGELSPPNVKSLESNHYRILYESRELPSSLRAEEHTAQIDSDEARRRQDGFKNGRLHLLSSSTTFEVGVDLGDLDVVFMRNVPPESFNYLQRAGRAGRRDKPGLVLTYCRRNPHDLYHYENPENRILNGVIHPPQLSMTNEKILLRHMVAVALAMFFRENPERFKSVTDLVGDWDDPRARQNLYEFCENNIELEVALLEIVPKEMHHKVGLLDDTWINELTGEDSRLSLAEAEVCNDYVRMAKLRKEYFDQGRDSDIHRIGRRMDTVAVEHTLNFLSRKAVIPKYGFPVDVVNLEIQSVDFQSQRVALQRDLSQAIAEYAPGGKVVADKLEWESCGVKAIVGKSWPVRYYSYDNARNFKQWDEETVEPKVIAKKYLIPTFGFVTPLFQKPQEPRGRSQRLYTTRPFFPGFQTQPAVATINGIRVTEAVRGMLVILCEGRNKRGFHICRACGRHMSEKEPRHKTPLDSECSGTLERFSLAHELTTDVVRLQFPGLTEEWDAYSVAYAILLGAADTLQVPDSDLNATVTGGERPGESSVVLYDNVPGGAGLVSQVVRKEIFMDVLTASAERVSGNCGCDSSCYGCLRSYRNQFAHAELDRVRARDILTRSYTG